MLGTALVSMLIIGCKNSGISETTPTGSTIEHASRPLKIGVVYDNCGKNDKSFNQSIAAGIEDARKELGIKAIEVESKTESDYEPNINSVLEQNPDLIFVTGVTTRPALERAAKEHPEAKFIYVSSPIGGANIRSIGFKEQEGSFLAGCAAAYASKTKKVGFVGGMQVPIIEKFQAGFEAGAKTADPTIKVLPAKYIGNFENIDSAKVAANVLFNQGADVVFVAAGRASSGVLRAAKESNKLAIGVDSNQDGIYPGNILTSMMKNCNIIVFDAIKSFKDGSYQSGPQIYGLKQGGLQLTEMKYTYDKISPENHSKIREFQDKIADGQINVPSNKRELAEYLKTNGL